MLFELLYLVICIFVFMLCLCAFFAIECNHANVDIDNPLPPAV
jgi:hypothetical protein